jgi:hypothetical protein
VRVLLFAGAGVSAELGVPAMRAMAEAFLGHLRDSGYPDDLLSHLEQLLEEADLDMESVIDDLDSVVAGARAGARWGMDASAEAGALSALRAEAEWLVSHLCERVDAEQSSWLWRSVLRSASPQNLTICTTNYDRAVEQAAISLGIPVADGFPEFGGAELVAWQGFDSEERLRLLKVHGSTDWYHEPAGAKVWKLRHAMPLFGGIRVGIEGSELQLGSALVLPSREKKVTNPPYPELAFEFRKAVDAAELVVFVGSSLRDPDLLDLASHSAARRPTLIVSRAKREGLPGTHVAMSASRFLISVVPELLTQATSDLALEMAQVAAGQTESILGPYATAMNRSAPPNVRCTAIETLAAGRVALQANDVRHLLTDETEIVRTFALGLVADSHDEAGLRSVVEEIAAAAPDGAFAREASYISKIAEQGASTQDGGPAASAAQS